VKRVFVALDASSLAPKVLEAALSLAEKMNGEVHALSMDADLVAQAAGRIHVVPPLIDERAWWEQVLDAAKRVGADTLVIGSGTSGNEVDDDAARVLEHAGRPVLVVYKRGSRLSLK
jgi:nucleotide-binding universal stress UspA family protein